MNNILLAAFAAAVASAALTAEAEPAHWSYQGKRGPTHWAEIDPGFSTCALGQMQSPIDIRNAVQADLPEIEFAYGAGPGEVVNNGHTIQINLPDSGGITIDGVHYTLLQFHFHTPSEEKIAGLAFPMTAHFVHKNAADNLAVVAVLLKEGKQNQALEPVFDWLPAEGEQHALANTFDPTRLLPVKRGYYAFQGSLTTPPCSENVLWHVLKEPIEVSKDQLAAFRTLYPMNARPAQPLNGRQLLESRD